MAFTFATLRTETADSSSPHGAVGCQAALRAYSTVAEKSADRVQDLYGSRLRAATSRLYGRPIRRQFYASNGTIDKLTFHLGPDQLTDQEREQIRLAQIRGD